MAELQKAKLQEVAADENQKPLGDAIPVQFNPTSLKLKLTNQSSGGRTRGRQRRQNNSQSSTVLSMDLIFDSADEGSDAAPVSVREKTSMVEKFVLPKEGSSDPPPLLRFEWDKLIVVGIVESLDINFDHFAANGAPLRAKMGLSIKEQEPKYAYLKAGPGKKDSGDATNPGDSGKGSPGKGTNTPAAAAAGNRSATALDGETAAEFLARQGLDPTAWRGLDVDLSAGLSLEAGVEVGFSAGLGAGVGVGVSAGVMTEVGVSLNASLGFGASAVFSAGAGASAGASAGATAGTSASVGTSASIGAGAASGGIGNRPGSPASKQKKIDGDSAGLALSAAGGVRSAIETVKLRETQGVASAAQSAFGLPASKATTANSPRVDSPRADPRSTSYGYGVPMEPLYTAALNQEQVRLYSYSSNSNASRGLREDNGPAFRKQKTQAPWVALPQRDKGRELAQQRKPAHRCKPCECKS